MALSLADVKPASRIKALHVGRSGSGKTIGAASLARLAPEGEKIYIFDNDGRIRPILKMFPDLLPKIDFDTYTSDDFEKLYDKTGWLLDHPDKYWGVVMDGLTMLSNMTIDYAIGINTPNNAKRKTDVGVLRMPEIQEYKAETRGMSTILDELRTYPRHFVMSAHLMTIEYRIMNKATKQEESRVERLLVTAGRKIAPTIPLYFDEVYLFKPFVPAVMGDLPEYNVYTTANEYFEECRSALSLPSIINMTMSPGGKGFYEMVMEEVKKNMPDQASLLLEK